MATRSTTQTEPSEVTDRLKTLLDDTQELIQKHVELAKQEVLEAVEARVKAAVAGAVAGVLALFALGFLAWAAAFGLATVMPLWLAALVVAGGFLFAAAIAGLVGRKKMVEPPMAPERTVMTLKEDRRWARAQIRR